MRTFFLFILAVLWTIVVGGSNSAQAQGMACHEVKQDVKTAKADDSCMAKYGQKNQQADVDRMSGCCGGRGKCCFAVIHHDVSMSSGVAPLECSAQRAVLYVVQPVFPEALRGYHSGIPPPPWPVTPAYIEFCTLLI